MPECRIPDFNIPHLRTRRHLTTIARHTPLGGYGRRKRCLERPPVRSHLSLAVAAWCGMMPPPQADVSPGWSTLIAHLHFVHLS